MKKLIKMMFWKIFGKSAFIRFQAFYWVRRLKRELIYEKEIGILPKFVFPGSIVIDVGANCGQYTYPLSKLVGTSGKVLSFEPTGHAFEVLKIVKSKLQLKNVELYKIALSDKKGRMEIKTPVDNSGIPNIGLSSFTINESKTIKEMVDVDRLDSVLNISKVEPMKISFVKCDVEGSELFVLKGAENLLKTAKPVLLLEVDEEHIRAAGYTVEHLFEFLENLGYAPYRVDGSTVRHILAYRKQIPNYIFLHRTKYSTQCV